MPVSVQFAGKPRTLKFDIPTYRTLEATLDGKPMGQIIGHLGQVSLTAMTAALWAGFKHEDPVLTEAQVGRAFEDYIDSGGRIHALGKALNDALFESGLLRDDDTSPDPLNVNIVELDRPRHVRFGMRAARMLEESLGGLGIAAVSAHIGQLGITALTTALCVGLMSEDKHITLNLTVKMVDRYVKDGGSVRRLATVVQKAIDDSGIFRNDALDLNDEASAGNAQTAATSPI